MDLRLRLAALLLLCAVGARAASPGAGKRGANFGANFMEALKIARTSWKPDACLAALDFSDDPPTEKGVVTPGGVKESYDYFFYSPSDPSWSYVVKFGEGDLPEHSQVRKETADRCITKLKYEIHEAIGLAAKKGLIVGPKVPVEARLDRFDSAQLEPIERRDLPPSLGLTLPRNRDVWLVSSVSFRDYHEGGELRQEKFDHLVILDAETGKVLGKQLYYKYH